jgi:hypothetical protein
MQVMALCCAFAAVALSLPGSRALAQAPVRLPADVELVPGIDTLDTWSSRGASPPVRGVTYVRRVSGSRDGGWTVELEWFDSTGAPTTTQRTETQPGGLTTRAERVRAVTDSASLLLAHGRATGWVVPVGESARLIDEAVSDAFMNAEVASLAAGAAQAEPGVTLTAPITGLFGPDPLAILLDSARVDGPVRLRFRGQDIECLRFTRSNGRVFWVERASGRLVARRGRAGPVTFWHVVRGVELPRE